jgi:hypothetical protein
MLGTEIRTFTAMKEMAEYIADQLDQHRALFEDYSQWLGSLLRSCEEAHKNEDWYQKSAAAQKNTRAPPKKNAPENKNAAKKNKGKKGEPSVWVESGDVLLASTDQGQAEILFEAIEKIGSKIQDLEKFKGSIQQLERMGLGKNVEFIVYIEDDIPKKVVLHTKGEGADGGAFKFETELSVPAVYTDFGNG